MSGSQTKSEPSSTEEILELSRSFRELSFEVGKFLNDEWDTLTPKQRDILVRRQWDLLDIFIRLNARYVVHKAKLNKGQLDTLRSATTAMKQAANSIKNTKRAVSVATKAVGYGGAIYLAASTGNVLGLITSAEAIVKEFL